jgi:hypothetical protein
MKTVRKDINRLSSLVNQMKASEKTLKTKARKGRKRVNKAFSKVQGGVTTAINHANTMASVIECVLAPQIRGSNVAGLPTYPNNSSIKCKSVQAGHHYRYW